MSEYQSLHEAVFAVLEGYSLPPDVRKILETAYYSKPIPKEPRCCVCGTTENLYDDGWYGYRCSSPECAVF